MEHNAAPRGCAGSLVTERDCSLSVWAGPVAETLVPPGTKSEAWLQLCRCPPDEKHKGGLTPAKSWIQSGSWLREEEQTEDELAAAHLLVLASVRESVIPGERDSNSKAEDARSVFRLDPDSGVHLSCVDSV